MLKPSTDYSVNLNYILKNKYIFSLAYDHMSPIYFSKLAYQSTETPDIDLQDPKLGLSAKFLATAIIPFKIGHWLDSHATLQAEYSPSEM